MANLKEDNTWEQGIYQFETSDPVMGGPNGIDNVPTRQLANRTLWLKNQLAAAEQSINTNQTNANNTYATKATTLTAGIGLTGGGTLGGNRVLSMGKPSKITATSTDEAVSDTHSHSIDKASTSVAGIVMLVNALNSTATDRALTAAQGKALADALGALGDEAFKQRGTLGSRNLDTLKGITNFGVWFMSANAGATTALNYPADIAGTLLVLPAAYEGIQLYIPFEWAQIYIRNTTQSGAWSDWRIIGEVANSLTSTSATAALSAAQGKNLQDNKADKATTLAGYGLGNAIAVLTGTIADGGTIPLPAGFSEAQCKFMVSTARDNPEDVPWDIDESGRHVHYGYECTLNGRVVSCKVWLNKKRTTMGNAHPEITVPGRANYLVIAYK